MWSRLDDALIDHRKVFTAGDLIGKNGAAIALGFFAVGLMWSNKHLTDGVLPKAVVKQWSHVDNPVSVADALVQAKLFDKVEGGYKIHDFHDFNPKASSVKKRREDRHRDRKNGHDS